MALYQNGILVSGANQLPQMTMAEYLAISASDRPTYWICTDRNYDDLSADNVTYGSGSVADALDDKVNKSGDTMSGNLTIDRQSGTTSAIGSSAIAIGNNLPSGTDKNSRGYVELYGTGAYYARLRAGDLTAHRVIDLPNKNGTFALTNDLDGVRGAITYRKSYSLASASTITVLFKNPQQSGFVKVYGDCNGVPANFLIAIHSGNLGEYNGYWKVDPSPVKVTETDRWGVTITLVQWSNVWVEAPYEFYE